MDELPIQVPFRLCPEDVAEDHDSVALIVAMIWDKEFVDFAVILANREDYYGENEACSFVEENGAKFARFTIDPLDMVENVSLSVLDKYLYLACQRHLQAHPLDETRLSQTMQTLRESSSS